MAGNGERVTPAEETAFFTASMQVAATLVGLLFVAVSLRPETVMADKKQRAVAQGAFIALVNGFFLSMGGALPGGELGWTAIVVGSLSFLNTLALARDLRPVDFAKVSFLRSALLLLASAGIYGSEIVNGILIERAGSGSSAVASILNTLFSIYAIGILRSWQLLGAPTASVLHGLLTAVDAPREDAGSPSAWVKDQSEAGERSGPN